MSLDTFFAGLLKDKAGVWDLEQLEKRVVTLEVRIKELQQQPTLEREAYTLDELSEQIDIKPATIRKYITEGKIKGFMPKGKNRWYIKAEEYERVVRIKKTTGDLYKL